MKKMNHIQDILNKIKLHYISIIFKDLSRQHNKINL